MRPSLGAWADERKRNERNTEKNIIQQVNGAHHSQIEFHFGIHAVSVNRWAFGESERKKRAVNPRREKERDFAVTNGEWGARQKKQSNGTVAVSVLPVCI